MPKPADYPEVVWKLLAILSRRDFVFRYEVPAELEGALAIARAGRPPLVKLFDTGIVEPIELGTDPSGEGVTVQLPQLAISLTREGAAALAWQEAIDAPKANAGEIETKVKAPAKRGPKGKASEHRKIATEYSEGLEAGEWKSQADYLRKKHTKKYDQNPQAARVWLSQLLKKFNDERVR